MRREQKEFERMWLHNAVHEIMGWSKEMRDQWRSLTMVEKICVARILWNADNPQERAKSTDEYLAKFYGEE